MVAIAATNSATLTAQQSLLQGRLAQAKREAEQAEILAQELRQQADLAVQVESGSRTDFNRTQQQALEAQATYSARSTASGSAVPASTQDFLLRMYAEAADKFAASGNPLKTNPNSAPVKNTLGQATGRIVNVSA